MSLPPKCLTCRVSAELSVQTSQNLVISAAALPTAAEDTERQPIVRAGRYNMGIDMPSVQFLCCAKSIGVDFSDTMMIGRQAIHAPPAEFAPLLSVVGIPNRALRTLAKGEFAEPLFGLLGAKNIRSLDVSNFEQATDIYDLNEPLPQSLSKMFSVVYDGGAIEHIFNAVQAFKNGMEMVRVGGHFIQVNVANNFMGHGFWQFSPELIYRVFSPENGFKIRGTFLHEVHPGGSWYKVDDPLVCRSRVELCNNKPTYICTIAQRISDVPVFSRPGQQSDYDYAWKQALSAPTATISSAPMPAGNFSIRQLIPGPFKRVFRRCIDMMTDPFERPYYRRILSH